MEIIEAKAVIGTNSWGGKAYCVNKGVVPICGCRKPNQVKELAEAVKVKLTSGEIRKLEEAADKSGAKVLGHDLFRFAVLKKRS